MLVDALRQIDLVLNAAKKKALTDAGPTSSKVCISKRSKCGNLGTKLCTQMVGLYDKH